MDNELTAFKPNTHESKPPKTSKLPLVTTWGLTGKKAKILDGDMVRFEGDPR
jgi:hypothetical protein